MTGFIIGALGIPRLRMSKMPITIENNAGVELYNKYQEIKQQQKLADEINEEILLTNVFFLDCVIYLVTLGIAIAINNPSITITANNSTNVNPFLFFISHL